MKEMSLFVFDLYLYSFFCKVEISVLCLVPTDLIVVILLKLSKAEQGKDNQPHNNNVNIVTNNISPFNWQFFFARFTV